MSDRLGFYRSQVISFDSTTGNCKLVAVHLFGDTIFEAKAASHSIPSSLPSLSQGDIVWTFFPGGEDTVPYWISM